MRRPRRRPRNLQRRQPQRQRRLPQLNRRRPNRRRPLPPRRSRRTRNDLAGIEREFMESKEVLIGPKPPIEVHKYYGGVVPVAVLLALVLQAFLPVYIRSASYLELPLLVTLYFALSKRNPSSGLLLGMV